MQCLRFFCSLHRLTPTVSVDWLVLNVPLGPYLWCNTSMADCCTIVIGLSLYHRTHAGTSIWHSIILFCLSVRMPMPIHDPHPRTWLVSGTCCSSPLRTSASSLMSCTISSLMTGSQCRLQLPSHPLSGRYFPPLLPSALAGVGKPPKPASLLPPPPPFLLPFYFISLWLPSVCVGWTLMGSPCPTQKAQIDPFRHAWKHSSQRGPLLVCEV